MPRGEHRPHTARARLERAGCASSLSVLRAKFTSSDPWWWVAIIARLPEGLGGQELPAREPIGRPAPQLLYCWDLPATRSIIATHHPIPQRVVIAAASTRQAERVPSACRLLVGRLTARSLAVVKRKRLHTFLLMAELELWIWNASLPGVDFGMAPGDIFRRGSSVAPLSRG